MAQEATRNRTEPRELNLRSCTDSLGVSDAQEPLDPPPGDASPPEHRDALTSDEPARCLLDPPCGQVALREEERDPSAADSVGGCGAREGKHAGVEGEVLALLFSETTKQQESRELVIAAVPSALDDQGRVEALGVLASDGSRSPTANKSPDHSLDSQNPRQLVFVQAELRAFDESPESPCARVAERALDQQRRISKMDVDAPARNHAHSRLERNDLLLDGREARSLGSHTRD
jgi:hypothetical protein